MTSELIVIVLTLVNIPRHLTTCPQSWYYMDDYPSICYSDVSKTAYTWTSAQTQCTSLSQMATLPYFNTVSEYQSYRRYAIYKNLSSSCAFHWLGIDGSGMWVSDQIPTFTYFDTSQVSSCGSNYVVQHYSTGYDWTKVCNLKTTNLFLCQLRVGDDPPQASVTYAQCQNGWLADSFGNCYYYVNIPDKWTNANANCKSMKANLPQFCYTNGDYFDFVQQQMFFEPFGCMQDTWLGSKTGSQCTFDGSTKFFNIYPSTGDCSVKKTYYCQIHTNYACAPTTILTSSTTSTSRTSSPTTAFTTTGTQGSSVSELVTSVTSNSQAINKTIIGSTISITESAKQSSSSAASSAGFVSSTTMSTSVSHVSLTSYSGTTMSAYVSSNSSALTTNNLVTQSTISTSKNQVITSSLASITLTAANRSTSGGLLATNLTTKVTDFSISIISFITSIYSMAENSSGTTGGQTQYTTITSTTPVTSISTGGTESPSSTIAFYTSKTVNISSILPSTLSPTATYNFSVPSSSYDNTNKVSQTFSQPSSAGLISFNNTSLATNSTISAIMTSSSSFVQAGSPTTLTSGHIIANSYQNTFFTSNFKITYASQTLLTISNTSNKAISSTYTILPANFSTSIIKVTNSTQQETINNTSNVSQESSSTTAGSILSSSLLTPPSSMIVTYGAGSTLADNQNLRTSTTFSMKGSTLLHSSEIWNISLNQSSSGGSTSVISTMSSVLNSLNTVTPTFSQPPSASLNSSNITSEGINSTISAMIASSSSIAQSSTPTILTSEHTSIIATSNQKMTSFTSNFKTTYASQNPTTTSNTSNRALGSTTIFPANFSTDIIKVTYTTQHEAIKNTSDFSQESSSTTAGSIMPTMSTILILPSSMIEETSGAGTTLYQDLGMSTTFSMEDSTLLYSSHKWNSILNQSSPGSSTTGNAISTMPSNVNNSGLLSKSTFSSTDIFVTSQTTTYPVERIETTVSTSYQNSSNVMEISAIQMQYTSITGIEAVTSMYGSTFEVKPSTMKQTYHEIDLKTDLLENSSAAVVSGMTSTILPSLNELNPASQTTSLGMMNLGQTTALLSSSNNQWSYASGSEIDQQITSATGSSMGSLSQSFAMEVSPLIKIHTTTSFDVVVNSKAQLFATSTRVLTELVTDVRTNAFPSLTASSVNFFEPQTDMMAYADHITFAFAADEILNEQLTSQQGSQFQQSGVLTTSIPAALAISAGKKYASLYNQLTYQAFLQSKQSTAPTQAFSLTISSKSTSLSGKITRGATTSTVPGNIKTTGTDPTIRQSKNLISESSRILSFKRTLTEQNISTLNILGSSVTQSPIPSTTINKALSYLNLLDILSGRSFLSNNIAVSTKPPFSNVQTFMTSLYPALDSSEGVSVRASATSSGPISGSLKLSITSLQGNLTPGTLPAMESIKSKPAGSTASATNDVLLNTKALGNNLASFMNAAVTTRRSISSMTTSMRSPVMGQSATAESKIKNAVLEAFVNSTPNILASTRVSIRLVSASNIIIEEATTTISKAPAYASYASDKPTVLVLSKTDNTTPDGSHANMRTLATGTTSRSDGAAFSNFSTMLHTTVVTQVIDQQTQASRTSTKQFTYTSSSSSIPVRTHLSNLTKPAISSLKTNKLLDRTILNNSLSGSSYSVSVSKDSSKKTPSFPTSTVQAVSLGPNPTSGAVMNYTVNGPVPTNAEFSIDKSVEEQNIPSSVKPVANSSSKKTWIPVPTNPLSLSSTPQQRSNEISDQFKTTVSGHNHVPFPTSQKSLEMLTATLFIKPNNQHAEITLSPGISANNSSSNPGESQDLLTAPPFQARRMFPPVAADEESLLDDENGFAKLPTAEKLDVLGVDEDALQDPMALMSSMQDSLSFMMQSLNDSLLSEIGEQRKSLIFDCLFDRHSCNNDKDIIRIRNSLYGNCFSFNNNNATLPKYTISAGMENGLKIILHIDQTDYNCNVEQAGIRMIIHDQEVQPTPEMDGYYIETGVVTYFNIIQSHQVVLKPRCFDLSDRTFDYVYSVENCQLMCYQDYMVSKCNCTDPRYMSVESRGYAKCGIDRKTCLDYHLNCNNTLEQVECDCKPECSDMSYTSTMTKTQMKSNADADHECRLNSSASICHQDMNYALIYVYYGSMSAIVYSEDYAYGVMSASYEGAFSGGNSEITLVMPRSIAQSEQSNVTLVVLPGGPYLH